jgi:hypothetical protein
MEIVDASLQTETSRNTPFLNEDASSEVKRGLSLSEIAPHGSSGNPTLVHPASMGISLASLVQQHSKDSSISNLGSVTPKMAAFPVHSACVGEQSTSSSTKLISLADLAQGHKEVQQSERTFITSISVGKTSLVSLAQKDGTQNRPLGTSEPSGGICLASLSQKCGTQNQPLVTSGPIGGISLASFGQKHGTQNQPLGTSESVGGISLASLAQKHGTQNQPLGTSESVGGISLASLAQRHGTQNQPLGTSESVGGISLASLAQKHGTQNQPFETTFRGLNIDDTGKNYKSMMGTCDSLVTGKYQSEAKSIPILPSMQAFKLTPPSGGMSLADLASKHQSSGSGQSASEKLGQSAPLSTVKIGASRGKFSSSTSPSTTSSLSDLAKLHKFPTSESGKSTSISVKPITGSKFQPSTVGQTGPARQIDLSGLHLSVSPRTRITPPRPPSPMDEDSSPTDTNSALSSMEDSFSVLELNPGQEIKDIPKEILTKPSLFATVLCSKSRKRQLTPVEARVFKRTLSHPKFSYSQQLSQGIKTPDLHDSDLIPFDFATPSPDDIVKEKQKAAFTRGDDSKWNSLGGGTLLPRL